MDAREKIIFDLIFVFGMAIFLFAYVLIVGSKGNKEKMRKTLRNPYFIAIVMVVFLCCGLYAIDLINSLFFK